MLDFLQARREAFEQRDHILNLGDAHRRGIQPFTVGNRPQSEVSSQSAAWKLALVA